MKPLNTRAISMNGAAPRADALKGRNVTAQGVALGYHIVAFQANQCRIRRSAFTLFELILAIALSAALIALIGTAINLYLARVDASRNRVEETQLARSILSMIADDLRATAIYQPQDTSGISKLMASGSPFDVDSIDEQRESSTGGAASGGGGGSSSGSTGGLSGSTGSDGLSSSGSSSGSSQSSGTDTSLDEAMPLGVSGSLGELYVDVERLPSGDELFKTFTGYTNAPMAVPDGGMLPAATGAQSASLPHPSNLKSIRYFIRDGERGDASGIAATSLAPDWQLQAGGLVRQEIPRSARLMAEEMGESAVLESGQVLIAPEVVHIEFSYYDGEQITDIWDMAEEKMLPLAIEVRIWLASPEALAAASGSQYDASALLETARGYRQTVCLPMAEISRAAGAVALGASSSSSSSSSSSMGSSTSGSSSFGTGFGQQQ
ncbi:MAG: hypothetical protein L0228_04020 [Planctomycetes bacterium]|nr:hypothetical protein [Planctomycetota bacterium]